jgi:hypothetical protein
LASEPILMLIIGTGWFKMRQRPWGYFVGVGSCDRSKKELN